jgi:hypothetical protein
MKNAEDLIEVAEQIAHHAEVLGAPLLVIGAAALAGHRYVRLTQDLDLAGVLSVDQLRELQSVLNAEGLIAELRLPDAQDPLGGVLDVNGPFGQVQVISFADRFPTVIQNAWKANPIPLRQGSTLRIVPLAYLVVLKLYAGGFKSKADVIEVLLRNPEADLDAIEALCDRYRLRGFAEIRGELS